MYIIYMDPLKQKYKKFTLKFYDKELRHSIEHCNEFRVLLACQQNITYIDSWEDYDNHIGIHYNGILRSKSYKDLRAKFTNKETKIKGCYLFLQDIDDTKVFTDWICYCHMRQQLNWKRFIPSLRPLRYDSETSSNPSAPPPSPIITF